MPKLAECRIGNSLVRLARLLLTRVPTIGDEAVEVTLPLARMSVEEKLRTMESLWEDLCARAGDMQSPDWHMGELAGREAALSRAEDRFEDWDDAKRSIKNQVS